MIRIGDRVKYIGSDRVAYKVRKYYLVTGYYKELDMNNVMSELDEEFMPGIDVLDRCRWYQQGIIVVQSMHLC